MRETRPSGSEGGGPQPNAASLPLSVGSFDMVTFRQLVRRARQAGRARR
jgi:hypothetical protein